MIALLVAYQLFLLHSPDYAEHFWGPTFDLDLESSCAGQLVPGLDRLGLGVDVTQLDLYHDYTVDVNDGFASRVFTWHCDQGNTWTSPYDGVTYLVPDEVDSVESLSSGLLLSDAEIIHQLSDMRNSMSVEVGLGASKMVSVLGSFSGSLTYQTSQRLIERNNFAMAENKAQVNTHKVSLQPALYIQLHTSSLSTMMSIFINDLPDQLTNESAAAYAGFFEQFGTHYFAQADFGGSLSTWITIQSDLFNEMDSDSIGASVEASFRQILQLHGAWTTDTGSVDSRFASKTTHSERYYGGEENLFDTDGFKTWWPTVARNPWLHSGKIQPITDLLPDSHSKKQNLEDAYQVYLTHSYLGEVQQSVQTALKIPQSLDHKFLRDLNAQLDAVIALPLPSLDQAMEIQDKLVDYTVMPDWFKTKTQVCIRFGSYDEVCSQVGVQTGTYGGWNPPLDHSPCEGDANHPNCASGHMYFKAPTEETQRALAEFGAKFELIPQSSYVYVDYHQIYAARFVVNTSIDSTAAPAWLRSLRVCVNFDKIEGTQGVSCASGPNEWLTGEVRLLKNPAWWASPVSRADTISFYAIY